MKPTLLHCFLQPPPSLFCLWTGTHPAMQLAAASTAVAGGLAEGVPGRTREGATGLPPAFLRSALFPGGRRSVPAASIALARSSEPRSLIVCVMSSWWMLRVLMSVHSSSAFFLIMTRGSIARAESAVDLFEPFRNHWLIDLDGIQLEHQPCTWPISASSRRDGNVSRGTLVLHKQSRSVTTHSGSSFGAEGAACSDERVARKRTDRSAI
jgi:hypothetical protein